MGTISKVKAVQGAGHFDGKFGRMYKFEYEMEDGKCLQANHKTEDGFFSVGSEVEYDITRTHEQYGNSGKVGKPQDENQNGGGQSSAPAGQSSAAGGKYQKDVEGSKQIEALKLPSYALAYAKDLFVPVAEQFTDQNELAKQVTDVADVFLTFLKSKQ